MRRTVSYWESRISLSDDQETQIRAKLGNSADQFIDRARLVGGEYRSKAAAWKGPTPAEVRQAIDTLSTACATACAAIESLPAGAAERIREGRLISQSSNTNRELLRPAQARSMEAELNELKIRLGRMASACTNAKALKALNQGQGKEPDYARLTLIRELGEAYRLATGKEPACRSDGHFARIARVVLEAAGAESGLSNDTLNKIFRSGR